MESGFKTVYALSEGEMGDLEILAVFEDRDTAEAWKKYKEYIAGLPGGSNNLIISEEKLVPKGRVPTAIIEYYAFLILYDDGTVTSFDVYAKPWTPLDRNPPAISLEPEIRKSRFQSISGGAGGNVYIRGANLIAVKTAAGEQLQKWRAANPKSAFWEEK